MWTVDTEGVSWPWNGANVATKHLRNDDDLGNTTKCSWTLQAMCSAPLGLASISLLPPVQPRSGVHTHRQNRYRRYKTMSDHMEDECAPALHQPIRHIYRGGRWHYHADMSVVVPITLSCRPRVLCGHKVTWNISTIDIVAGTDTDFVGACTPALRRNVTVFQHSVYTDV